MAARDKRRSNNRKRVTTTEQRTRRIDQGTTDYSVYGSMRSDGGFRRATWNEDDPWKYSVFATADNVQSGNNTDKYLGKSLTTKHGGKGKLEYANKRFGWGVYGYKLNVSRDNPDKVVTDTISKTRLQALDKRSGSDDAQQNKELKTKKKGRSKLRIQASGDSSSARLKGGPNSGRDKNKLKIDVQSSGGKTGLNVPR